MSKFGLPGGGKIPEQAEDFPVLLVLFLHDLRLSLFVDPGRQEDRLFHRLPGKLHFHQNGVSGRRAEKLGHQVEDKVPQAVKNQGSFINLSPLQDMGVVSHDQLGPGIDGGPPQGQLRPGQGPALAEAPVKGRDHEIRFFLRPPNHLLHHLHIIGIDAGGAIERIAPDHGNPGLL